MMISKELIKSNIKLINGFLPVYKPAGLCSHRLTEGLRWDLYYMMKYCGIGIGNFYLNHARDLEPFADGLVTFIMGYAKGTRRNFNLANYVYRARIEFGVERQYHSIDGKVLSRSCADHIGPELIKEALPNYVGMVDQGPCSSYRLFQTAGSQESNNNNNNVPQHCEPTNLFNQMNISIPPVYTAKSPQKYPYVPAPRTMLVEDIQLVDFMKPYADFTISCHGDFKVRQFAADMAHLLGTKGSVVKMSRIKEGPITVEDSRVFQTHELNLEYYLPRMHALKNVYKEFNEEMEPLWEYYDETT